MGADTHRKRTVPNAADRGSGSAVESSNVEDDSRGSPMGFHGVGPMEGAWVAVGALVLLAGAAGLSAARGALGAARNDDWAYYRIVFRFASTGRFQLDHWTQAMLIGQAVAAWPVIRLFGPSIVALQLTVAAMGCVGVALTYFCVRRLLSARMALIAVLPLALGPLFGSLAVSFMTDVPALTLQVTAVYLSVRAMESARYATVWWAGAMVAGSCAFSVREYGVTTFLAVAVAAVSAPGTTWQRRMRLGMGALCCAAMGALYIWRQALPGTFGTTLRTGLHQFHDAQSYLLSFSLLLLPASWMVSWRRLGSLSSARRQRRIVLAAMAALLIALAVGDRQLLGNYVSTTGYSLLPGVQPLFSAFAWRGVVLVAATAEATLIALVILTVPPLRSLRIRASPTTRAQVRQLLLLTVIFGILAQLGMILLSDSPAYDRYILVLLPFASALVLDTALRWRLLAGRRGRLLAAIAAVAYALVGIAYVDRAAQYDGAAWRLGNVAVLAGYDPATIDAGYAWIGYHQTGLDAWPGAPDQGFWITPELRQCVVVFFQAADDPVPAATLGVVMTASPPSASRRLVAALRPDGCPPDGRPPR